MPLPQLAKNILVSLASQGVLLILGLFSTHAIFAYLGGDALGIVNFSLLISSILVSFFDAGINIVAVREIAANRTSDPPYATSVVQVLAGTTLLTLALSLFIVGIFSSLFLSIWTRTSLGNEGTLAFFFMTAGLLCGIVRAYFSIVLAGYDRIDFYNYAQLAFTLLQQIGIIILAAASGSLMTISFWYLISGVISCGIFGVGASHIVGRALFMPRWKPRFLLENASFIGRNFCNGFLSSFLFSLDRWFISRVLPLESLGLYGTVQGIAGKVALMPNAILSPAFVRLSHDISSASADALYLLYRRFQDLTLIAGVIGSGAVILFGDYLLARVFTPALARSLITPLFLLVVGHLFFIALFIPHWFALAHKRVDLLLRANIMSIPFTALVIGAGIGSYGITAAALVYACVAFSHYIFFIPRFSRICIHRKAACWYWETARIIGLAALAYAPACSVVFLLNDALIARALSFCIASGVFLLLIRLCVIKTLFKNIAELLRQAQMSSARPPIEIVP